MNIEHAVAVEVFNAFEDREPFVASVDPLDSRDEVLSEWRQYYSEIGADLTDRFGVVWDGHTLRIGTVSQLRADGVIGPGCDPVELDVPL